MVAARDTIGRIAMDGHDGYHGAQWRKVAAAYDGDTPRWAARPGRPFSGSN